MAAPYMDARTHGRSREPIVEMLIPSTLDAGLAPPARHVASLFCQHVAPQLPGGASWDAHREEVADLMIATVDRYAPNFRRSVLGRQIMSPPPATMRRARYCAMWQGGRLQGTHERVRICVSVITGSRSDGKGYADFLLLQCGI